MLDLDTGWKSPASNGVLWNNWSNGANAYVDDLNYATAEGTKTNDYGTFTFGLPAGAIIRGIEFYLKGFKEQVGDTTFPVYLSWNLGANMTAAKNIVVSGNNIEAANTVGGATDRWGYEWTVAETLNGVFWVGIDTNGAIGDDFDINHIQMKIYYQVCSSSSSSSSSFSSCSSSFSSSSFSSSSFSSSSFSSSSFSSSFSSSSSSTP